MSKKISVFLLFCLAVTSFVNAEKITFTANRMNGSAKKNASKTVLEGKAFIKTESIEISADTIELSGDDYRNIQAAGNVKGKNLESGLDFECSEMQYDRETKIALLSGDVDLTDAENDVSAKAQVIEYNSDTDIAVLQIGVNLTQKDNICSSSYAVYNKKSQMLNLSGNASIKQKEDTFRAQHITLDMKTEEITLDGRVKGTVSEKEESQPDEVIQDLAPAMNTVGEGNVLENTIEEEPAAGEGESTNE